MLDRGGTGTFYAVYNRPKGGKLKKVREVLGRYGTGSGELSLPEARKAHAAVLGRVAEVKATPGDIRRVANSGLTVAEATRAYVDGLINQSARPTSIRTVRSEILGWSEPDEREMPERSRVPEWLDRPMRTITARECRELHGALTVARGPHVANRVLANLRTVRPRGDTSCSELARAILSAAFRSRRPVLECPRWPRLTTLDEHPSGARPLHLHY